MRSEFERIFGIALDAARAHGVPEIDVILSGEDAALTRFAMSEVDLAGKPWIVTPIRTRATPTLYPVRPDTLYYNFGCYCQVKKRPDKGNYYYTKIIDRTCFDLGGIKMLYSSTFLPESEFKRIYNGAAYAALKKKYDPGGALPTLYQKCVTSES